MLDSLRDKARAVRDIISPPKVPDWDLVDRYRRVYSVAAKFIYKDGRTPEHRIPKVMPVEPDYEVITGVELLGSPRLIAHEETAAHPGNRRLPTIDQLQDPKFYRKNVMDRKVLTPAWRLKELGEDLPRHSRNVLSPLEAYPFRTNVLFDAALEVNCTYAVQPLGQETDGIAVRDSSPLRFDGKHLDVSSQMNEQASGIAYVAHVRVPVDLSKYFKEPSDLDSFMSARIRQDQNTALASELFEELFRNKLEAIGAEVGKKRKSSVRGVLLSPIKVHYRIADNIFRIGRDPNGELIIAATYLRRV